jgi:hypothetical protein
VRPTEGDEKHGLMQVIAGSYFIADGQPYSPIQLNLNRQFYTKPITWACWLSVTTPL